MKRILLSILSIGVVAVVMVMATQAFFSDEEKSVGNTFTAGSLDLKFQVGGAAASWLDVNGSPLFDSTTIALLDDMKPGDTGEKTVRLWVDDNPSCGKVSVNVTEDKDNSCTEPENAVDAENGLCVDPNGDGELNDAVNWAIWLDQGVTPGFQGPQDLSECDNDYVAQYEPLLTSGTVTQDKVYGIGELPISEATAKCYGIAYCFGTWNQDGTCNGSLVNNASQTDSFKADIIINALQKRNQFDGSNGTPNGCPTGDWLLTTPVRDYLDIGNVTDEAGHNVSTTDWSNAWVGPTGWGGNYGGGSGDGSFRLLMGKGDSQTCADPSARPATFTMNAGAGTATKLTLGHLDGAVNDSFNLYINNVLSGSYVATSTGGNEVWKTTTFTFPGVTGVVNVRLEATQPVASWCADWGQVAFSSALLE